MSLQEKLGEELYQQVQEKLGDEKIAIVSDGSYIPKDKFDEVNQEKNDYKQTLKERDEQLEGLSKKAKGNEDLEQQIQELKDENQRKEQEYETKMEEQRKRSKIELALKDAKAHDPSDIVDKLDLDTIKVDGEKLLGFDDQLNQIKEEKSYLFQSDDNPGLSGREPQPPKDKQPKGITKEQFAQMGYKERSELYNNDPDLYQQLKE